MKSKLVKAAAVTLVVMAGLAVLYAQAQRHMGGFGPGMMRHHMLGHIARYLQLTEPQKAQIKSMWEAEKPTAEPLIRQLADGHKQMMALTANGAFDEAKVRALASQQSATLAQLLVEKEKLQAQIYTQVLTPEQRTKVDQMRQKHTEKIDQWLQHMSDASAK